LSLALILALAVWIVSLNRENRGLIDREAEVAREIGGIRGERDIARAKAEDAQAQLNRPQLNIQIKDLLSGMTRARGDSGPVDVDLSASATHFALILPAPKTLAIFADPVYGTVDTRFGTNTGRRGHRSDARSKTKAERAAPAQSANADPQASVTRAAKKAGLNVFTRLKHSGREANRIARLVPPATRAKFTGFKANRDTLDRTDLGQYRILHFALHSLIRKVRHIGYHQPGGHDSTSMGSGDCRIRRS
jgi:hypothetical protein